MAASMRLATLAKSRRILAICTPFVQESRNILSPNIRSITLAASSLRHEPAARPLWSGYRAIHSSASYMSTDAATESTEAEPAEEYHSIIKNSERAKGASESLEFQAETRKLLDIVAQSLYSEKEVFIRELISNASDALEKFRYLQMTSGDDVAEGDRPLEIHIATDEEKKTFTVQDTGLGMTREELVENLGTIARSGSKAFMDKLAENKEAEGNSKNIIGQFGVGFYSAFMVGEKVDVYTQSHKPDSVAYKWTSDGLGKYEITEAEGVQRGTKLVIHLKGDSYDFAKEDKIKEVIKKYSNFVGVPIYLNGKKVNVIQALWEMETRDITEDMHEEFYRFISQDFAKPRYHLHYKTDAPLNIRALFYIPDYKPTMYDMSRENDGAVSLYSRKVMILNKADHVLPKWLRFVKGVVDSEDIPLNLSRELLQDSGLIRRLRWVLTNRLIKFFIEKAKRDPEKYQTFYEDYGNFLREGIVTTDTQDEREEIAKLLRFDSSSLDPGTKTSMADYVSRMQAGDRTIYYFSAPSRELAESSPYMEAVRKRNLEVLFCYEPYDELVLMNLAQFNKKNLRSIENEAFEDKSDDGKLDESGDSLTQEQADSLLSWLQVTLGVKVKDTKLTNRLDTHPCVISVTEMGAARHFLRTTLADKSQEERYRLLQPTMEVNPKHPIIRKLATLTQSDPELAKLVAEQIYDNAMIAASLMDDPKVILNRMNDLLSKALEKH